MSIKEYDKVAMPDGKIGTLVDVYADGTKGVVEDLQKTNGIYQLYDVVISDLREIASG